MFEDEVRAVVDQAANPPFDKARALDLYVEKTVMDDLVEEDTQRYKAALEAAGGVFGGIEPIQRFHKAFQGPLSAAHAAAAVGLETEIFLEKISKNVSLQNILGALVLENGAIKRDAWTSAFHDVVTALDSPDSVLPPVVERPERIPGAGVHIPDPNLRKAIAEALSKAPGDPIAAEGMETLERFVAENKNISDLTGLEFAKNLTALYLTHNALSDISPLAALTKLREVGIGHNPLSDLSPLASLTKMRQIRLDNTEVTDLSPLASLLDLEEINVSITPAYQISIRWQDLKNLKKLDTVHSDISDLSPLAGLTNLTRLYLYDCKATDLFPLKRLNKS